MPHTISIVLVTPGAKKGSNRKP